MNADEDAWRRYIEDKVEKELPSEFVEAYHGAVVSLRRALRMGNLADAEEMVAEIRTHAVPHATRRQQMLCAALFMYHVSPCVPTRSACEEIMRALPPGTAVLEVNAHHGVWGRYLQLLGCTVHMVHREAKAYGSPICDVHVTESPASFLQGAGDRYGALLLVRPELQDNMGSACACVRWFRGDTVVYVGAEPCGEDAGPRHVWTLLERDFVFSGHAEIPVWPWRVESVMIYKRRK